MNGWGSDRKDYEMETPSNGYEEIECPKCHRIGVNVIEKGVPVRGHPNVEEEWLVCKCGHNIMEITE